jgi:hypothetical protein
MCGDDGIPFILRHVEEHALAQNARHRHHAVDVAVGVDGGRDEALAGVHFRNVVGHGEGLAARLGDLGHDGLGHLAARILTGHRHAVVGHDDLGPLGRRGQRNRPPDAATAAGDRDDLVLEEPCHLVRSWSQGPASAEPAQNCRKARTRSSLRRPGVAICPPLASQQGDS